MPLNYARKIIIMEIEINLKEHVSKVIVTRGASWAVGNASVVLINFPMGKYPQQNWPVRQAGQTGSGGRHNCKGVGRS